MEAAKAKFQVEMAQFEESQRKLQAQGQPTLLRGEITFEPGASNVAPFQEYTNGLRAAMSAPTVIDAELKGLIEQLYRPGASIGSGSTAAAVREELTTRAEVGGKWHVPKAGDYVKTLERWLQKNPTGASGDRAAAENVIKDSKNALSGK